MLAAINLTLILLALFPIVVIAYYVGKGVGYATGYSDAKITYKKPCQTSAEIPTQVTLISQSYQLANRLN